MGLAPPSIQDPGVWSVMGCEQLGYKCFVVSIFCFPTGTISYSQLKRDGAVFWVAPSIWHLKSVEHEASLGEMQIHMFLEMFASLHNITYVRNMFRAIAFIHVSYEIICLHTNQYHGSTATNPPINTFEGKTPAMCRKHAVGCLVQISNSNRCFSHFCFSFSIAVRCQCKPGPGRNFMNAALSELGMGRGRTTSWTSNIYLAWLANLTSIFLRLVVQTISIRRYSQLPPDGKMPASPSCCCYGVSLDQATYLSHVANMTHDVFDSPSLLMC